MTLFAHCICHPVLVGVFYVLFCTLYMFLYGGTIGRMSTCNLKIMGLTRGQLLHSNPAQVLYTCVCLCHQVVIFVTRLILCALMSCGWEGNHGHTRKHWQSTHLWCDCFKTLIGLYPTSKYHWSLTESMACANIT